MDAQAFWNIISAYNLQTRAVQAALLVFLLGMTALSYTQKIRWAAKCALGVLHLFIAIAFFARYGQLPIQRFFALPLFLACGLLFLDECRRNRKDAPAPPLTSPRLCCCRCACYTPFAPPCWGTPSRGW